MSTIAETIERTKITLGERGLPKDSYFEVEFEDGSIASEKDMRWSTISTIRRVGYFGEMKTVFTCNLPVKRITMYHGGMKAELEANGGDVYQAVRSETIWTGKKAKTHAIGRVIGVVKDDEVVEEKFLNGISNEVVGVRNEV